MYDDIAVDGAFRTLGLDWRSASVQDIIDAGRSGYYSGALPNTDINALANVAARFAYARRYQQITEPFDEAEDHDLIPAEDPDPPQAWELAPTELAQPYLRSTGVLFAVLSWPVRMWRRRWGAK